MFCSKCGAQLIEGAAFCSKCGGRTAAAEGVVPDVSGKSRLATSLLAWFLGYFGAHRFYAGKIPTAVIMLVMGVVAGACWFVGLFGPLAAGEDVPAWGLMSIGALLYFAVWIWSVIDFIIAVTGNFKDSQGRIIKKW